VTIRAPVQPAYTTGLIQVIGAAGTGNAAVPKASKQMILTNQGANVVYVRMSVGVAAATTADYPVPAGAQVVISKGDGTDTINWNSPAGTTLHHMAGEGW
jgi:hypothetical protein